MTNETPRVEKIEAHPLHVGGRRVREGDLYYVADALSSGGWSIVEIAGEGEQLAAFAIGQIEAIPLGELEGRILGPVRGPRPQRTAA